MDTSIPFKPPESIGLREQESDAGLLHFTDATGELGSVDLLCDAQARNALLESIKEHEAPITFSIGGVLDLDEETRWQALQTISDVDGLCVPDFLGSHEAVDLFEGVLGLLVPADEVDRCKRGIDCAIEAMVLKHPNAIREACTKLYHRLKELKVVGYTVAALVKEAEELQRELDQPEDEDPLLAQYSLRPFVKMCLAEAPLAENCVVPSGWRISEDGIFEVANHSSLDLQIAHAPMVITRRFRNLETAEIYVEIAWLQGYGTQAGRTTRRKLR